MAERVVITGIGMVSPLGIGVEESWKAMKAGGSGVGPITLFDTDGYPTTIAGEVKDFDPSKFMDGRESRRMDRFAQLAVTGAGMALENSGFKITSLNADRVGVFIGSGIGGMATFETQVRNLQQKGPDYVSPRTIPMMISDMGAGYVSIVFGAKGPNVAITSACATSAHAIDLAAKLVRDGDVDAMIAGGSEASISPLGVAAFAKMKALSRRNDEPTRASRPFDAKRDGFVIAEGAGVVILESLKHAMGRDAPIYAELIGSGMTGDAHHITAMPEDGDGPARAMLAALNKADMAAEQVDFLSAHATSTELGDKAETVAIKRVFGDHVFSMPVNSIKSMTGHMLGAAGATELIACLLVMRDGVIPPTINYENPDPHCDLDCVPNEARHKTVNVAMSNAFGFGGHNSALLVKKLENV